MPHPRTLAVAFQSSMTRCWAAPIHNSRTEQVWRALQRAERFYMYSKGAGGPEVVLFSLQDRDFGSEDEFREFAAKVRSVVNQANEEECRIELAHYPAQALTPRFYWRDTDSQA
jgi:hypothetical protein